MPIYKVADPSGLTLEMEGDAPPTEQDIDEVFGTIRQQGVMAPYKPGVGERVRQFLGMEPAERPVFTSEGRQIKPLGSQVDREGVMGLLAASPEKRQLGQEIGEQVGGVVGPKTGAAMGVVGRTAADLLSPMSVMTLGTLGAARQAAALPGALQGAQEAMTAADALAASRAAKTSQMAERGLGVAFAPAVASGVAESVPEAARTIASEQATGEDKARAAAEAGISLLFAAGLGAGAARAFREVTGAKQGPWQREPGALMEKVGENLAQGKQARADAMAGLERLRVELDAVEATLPKDKTTSITEQQAQIEQQLARTRTLMDQALAEAQKPRIETGEPTAIEQLRRQDIGPVEPSQIVAPESYGEGPREFVELGQRPVAEVTGPSEAVPTAEQLIARRVEPNIPPFAEETQREAKPLRSIDDIMAEQAKRRVANVITEELESGRQQGQPVNVTKRKVEEALGIGRKTPGPSVAESTIFNEVWESELAKAKARGPRQPKPSTAEQAPGAVEAKPEKPLQLFIDGVEGKSVPFSDVPGGNPAFEYAIGTVEKGGVTGVFRRPVEQSGTYGGWRWETEPSKLTKKEPQQPLVERIATALQSAKIDTKGKVFDATIGLPVTVWNGALDVAIAMVKAGAKAADAVQGALRYIRESHKEAFDEAKVLKALQDKIDAVPDIRVPPGMRARRFAERVVASEEVARPVRQEVAKSPQAAYRPQEVEALAQVASVKPESELLADYALKEKSESAILSGIEAFNRMHREGRFEDATRLGIDLAKTGTRLGQLVNQFKLLKSSTPQGLAFIIDESRKKKGEAPMTPEERKLVVTVFDEQKKTTDAIIDVKRRVREALNPENPASMDELKPMFDEWDGLNQEDAKNQFEMMRVMRRVNPSSMPSMYLTMMQGAVQTVQSAARNLSGNTLKMMSDDIAEGGAMLLQKLFRVTNPEAQVTFRINDRVVTRLKAMAKSIPGATRELLKGQGTQPYEVGMDVSNPLNFQEGIRDVMDIVRGNIPASRLPRSLAEATIGIAPDVMLRLNKFTDTLFRSKQQVLVSELAKERNFSEQQIEAALRDPELLYVTDEQAAKGRKGFTSSDLAMLELETAKSVYQQENIGTEAFSRLNNLIRTRLGETPYTAFRALTSLFQKTPVNVVAEVMQYTPGVNLGQLMLKDMSPREKWVAGSKAVMGMMMTSAGILLYKNGLITSNLESSAETEKARQLALAGGVMPPGSINISGVRRLLAGKDPSFKPGDKVTPLYESGVPGAMFTMVGAAMRSLERSRESEMLELTAATSFIMGTTSWIFQQQFLKGTHDFMQTLANEGKGTMQAWARNLAVTATSPFMPNLLASIDRAQRESVPVIGGDGVVKAYLNEANRRLGVLGLQLPGGTAPDKLPLRRDLWGNTVPQTPKGENPWVYNMVSPKRKRTIEDDPVNATVYNLWRKTADNSAIPSIPARNITIGGQTHEPLTSAQYDRYTQLIGWNRRAIVERMMLTPMWSEATAARRIEMLSRAYERGQRIGKYQFIKELRDSGGRLVPMSERRGIRAVAE